MVRLCVSPVRSLVCVVVLLAGAAPALAQLNVGNQWPNPRINSIFPPGGKVGETVEVTIAGVDAEEPKAIWFSNPAIKATIEESKAAAPDPKKPDMKKGGTPSTAKIIVSIDKTVPSGLYDVRLINAKGISNPRVFVVGAANEVLEKEPNNEVEQAQKIDIGTTVNGVISTPTDVDYYQVAAKKGQRLLIHVAGPSIDSRLNPELAVFDAQNRRVAYARALPYEDALLDFTAPADGDFFLRLNQFTYTVGTPDYFYRLTVGQGPWIDAIFPPVIEPGKPAAITVYGRGLPGGVADPKALVDGKVLEKLAVTVNAPADANKFDVVGHIPPYQGTMPGFEYRVGTSNPKFVGFAQAPLVIENDDNDTIEKAQAVKAPSEIVGRIDKLRDRDWFSFEAKKGDVLMIDAASQRLGAPTDLYFKLLAGVKKAELSLQDDTIEMLNPRGYYSASRDPQPYRFVAPEDGVYFLLVGSHTADNVADPTHIYRVRIAPEKPDFQLVVMPAEDFRADSCTIGRGGINYFNVLVQRQDGFKGDIVLTMDGLPAGVTCPTQILGAGTKSGLLAVMASDKAEKFEGVVKVTGTAVIGGQKVVREARPASVTWGAANPQGSAPAITRHDRALVLAVRDKAPLTVMPTKDKVIVSVGDKIDIPYKLTRFDPEFKGNFQVQAATGELPTGITVNNLTFAPGKDEQTMTVTTAATTVPGTYNLVLRGFAPIAMGKGKNVNTILPTGPVRLIVVPKQVATLTVDNPNAPVKVGGEAVLTLKVARLFDFPGEFKVSLLPDGANGVTAGDFVVTPGQNDAKLTLKAAGGANPGPRQNLTLRAVAVVEGITLNHDLKINVNVMAEEKKK